MTSTAPRTSAERVANICLTDLKVIMRSMRTTPLPLAKEQVLDWATQVLATLDAALAKLPLEQSRTRLLHGVRRDVRNFTASVVLLDRESRAGITNARTELLALVCDALWLLRP